MVPFFGKEIFLLSPMTLKLFYSKRKYRALIILYIFSVFTKETMSKTLDNVCKLNEVIYRVVTALSIA